MLSRAIALLGLVFLPSFHVAVAQTVSTEEIAEGVYLFTYDVHRSLFVVTEKGVVVTDPQSPERAEAYLREVRKITREPIRYLIYSHHHADHISGGEVFSGATVIAHEKTRRQIVAANDPNQLPPEFTFQEEFVLYAGDTEVRLPYLGKSETDNNIFVFLPQKRLVFTVDNVVPKALPWRDMRDGYPLEWIETLRRLEELNFDILAPGHGQVGSKNDVVALRRYLEDLRDAVQHTMEQGKSLDEMKKTIRLPRYKTWDRYERDLGANIEGMHRALTTQHR